MPYRRTDSLKMILEGHVKVERVSAIREAEPDERVSS